MRVSALQAALAGLNHGTFVTMHTIKSFSVTPDSLTTTSSASIFPILRRYTLENQLLVVCLESLRLLHLELDIFDLHHEKYLV